MLPPLEGEVRLKDESGPAFEQVVQNALKANQALKGSQAEVLRLEEVFARLNVKPAQGGGFMDALNGNNLQLNDVLTRALNSDNLGGATYRELATQIKEYASTTDVATQATNRLAEKLEALGPPKMTAFEKLEKRLQDVKKDFADLEKSADGFQSKLAQDAAQQDKGGGMGDMVRNLIPETEIGTMLQDTVLKLPIATEGMLTLAGGIGAVAAGAWAEGKTKPACNVPPKRPKPHAASRFCLIIAHCGQCANGVTGSLKKRYELPRMPSRNAFSTSSAVR